MIYIPFIIGGIGFVFWGLKGALIGAAIGGVISGFWYLFAKQTAEFNASKQEHKTSSQTSTGNNISPALLMKFRILALIASMMKADGVNAILKAVKTLCQYDCGGSHVLVHCMGENNRSRTVVEAFYFTKCRQHFDDEYKGCKNHLIWNCEQGYLPPLTEMENMLRMVVDVK